MRRVMKLWGSVMFVCRACLGGNYRSQQVSKRDRAIDRSWTLRRALGVDFGFMDLPAGYLPRPKGMHNKTFAKKIQQLERVEQTAVADTQKVLGSSGIDLL